MRFLSPIPFAVWVLGIQSTFAETAEQYVFQDEHHPLQADPRPVKNVAIIGAGSAGSSAAYYLRNYSVEARYQLNITIYERNAYIGGRSTTVAVYDDEENPAELGASIFVQANQNLVNAANEFNLSSESLRSATKPGTPLLGIWNSKEFVFTQASGGGWWDNAKLLWKYGLAPIKTVRLMKSTVGNFLNMYKAPYFPWSSLNQIVYDLGLNQVLAVTGEQYLKKNGIGDLFANEIIQASTRVNYAQNLPLIHGLETMVCMATEGAMAIEGGNWQIFSHMVEASRANVHLETQITKVEKLEQDGYRLSYKSMSNGTLIDQSEQSDVYDEVILAAPQQFSNIKFDPEPAHMPDVIPYVKLHVTLLTSKHPLSPAAFNLSADQQVPQIVLTTLTPGESYGSSPEGVGSPGFFSISTLRPVMDTRHGRENLEYLYKIFSPEPPNSTFLAHIFGLPAPEVGAELGQELDEEDVSWMYRKIWHSYPYEYPRVTFEELKLDEGEEGQGSLWYTSGIESFISTMETSSLMGMNVAKLIVNEWELLEESRLRVEL